MEKAFKNFLYAGVELAAEASNKFEKSVTDLVKKGKISETEGKKMVDDFISKSEERKDEFEKKFKELKDRFSWKKNEEEELEDLRKKVSDLEAKVKEKKSSKATAAA